MAAIIFVSAIPVMSMAKGDNWQLLVDNYRALMERGEREQALGVAREALMLAESVRERNPEQVAFSLDIVGSAYAGLGNYDAALKLQVRALEAYERAIGREHPYLASFLNNLAITYENLGRDEDALLIQKRALTINENINGLFHSDTALSLGELADTYRRLGRFDQALPLLQRALKIHENTRGPEDSITVSGMNRLANIYHELAQYDAALALQQRATNINEKVNGPESPNTAVSLSNQAATYVSLSRYDQALPLQLRALAIYEKNPQIKDNGFLNTLFSLGHIYSKTAQYDKALSLRMRAFELTQEIFGPEHQNMAVALWNLAGSYKDLGHYYKALPLELRALTINEKTSGPEHPNTAASLSNLAETYRFLGQHEKSLPLQMRALNIDEKVLGPEHPRTAIAINNLAGTYDALSQHDEVLALQQRSLSIRIKKFGFEHPDTALSLSNLAETYRRLGKYEETLSLHKQALAIFENKLGAEHPVTASSLSNLAGVYDRLGQYENALALAKRALAISEQTQGVEHSDTALHLNNVAAILKHMGQKDQAVFYFKLSINTYQHIRSQVLAIDNALDTYTRSVAWVYQALADLLIEVGRLSEAQVVLEMLKENEQFEFIRRNTNADPRLTKIDYNSTEQLWMDRYRQISNRLVLLGAEEQNLRKQVRLGLSAGQQQRLQGLTADLSVARKAFESFLKEMQDAFAQQGPAKAQEITETQPEALRELQDLLKGMGPDAVLLQYYVTSDKVGMLLTTPSIQLARSTSVSVRDLNRKIAEFRRMLRDPKADLKNASQALYQLLVAPVERDLEQAGAKTVMLSLDGALRYLPFGALHDGERYLVQRWNFPMFTSVTRNRLRDAASPRWQAAGLGVTRAFGEFAALPAVQNEMRSIIQASGRAGLLPGEIYLDEAFTAQRFKEVSQRPFQLLHVASHFRFSPGTEVNSFLLLGNGERLSLGDLRTQNYRFDNVDLLTLSACDTGLGGGRDAQGREIEGFGVIAQQQGAKAVVATLWPVADESTSGLMVEMYRRRQDERLSKIEALRQAQLSLLAQGRYAHPFYWAPFILMGNWQ